MKNKLILATAFFLMAFTALNAQDWPQFLGPERNSTSPQKGILRTWPESGPEVLWTANMGIGYGGPVVKDGKVYLLDRDDKVGDNLRCFELSTGKELWGFAYAAPGEVMFPGSRSVPAIDGNYVYSCGPYGDLYCIDITTHKPVWNKNVWTDFGGDPGNVPTDDAAAPGAPGGLKVMEISLSGPFPSARWYMVIYWLLHHRLRKPVWLPIIKPPVKSCGKPRIWVTKPM